LDGVASLDHDIVLHEDGGQGRLGRLFRRRRSGLAWPRQLGTSRGCSKPRRKERAPGGAAKELVDNAHAI
jgi:hypothetical protein